MVTNRRVPDGGRCPPRQRTARLGEGHAGDRGGRPGTGRPPRGGGPIRPSGSPATCSRLRPSRPERSRRRVAAPEDRKSTRLNSSHEWISYAVFCLKKKNKD